MLDILHNFHFLRPYFLTLVIPLAVVIMFYARRRLKAGGWSKVCDEKLLPFVLVGQQEVRSSRGLLAIGLCGLVAIIAMAGPAWEKLPQPVFRTQAALIIALDLSRSMDVQDIKPSRLTRARHKILDILNKHREGQTALIVYAAEPFVVTPLTEDTKTVATLVKDLSTDLMPSQGSYPEKAIAKAIELFKQSSIVNGHVLLVTDGIESSGMEQAVKRLTDDGYRLSILGVGTEEGAPIANFRGGFIKDSSGAIVVARLDETSMRQFANQGQGIYRTITPGDRDIDDVLRVISASRLKDTFTEQQENMKFHSDQWREEGPWLLLLLLPVIALAFRRGYLVLLFALLLPLPQNSQAFEWSSLWQNSIWQNKNQQARRALEAGDSKTAAEMFSDPEWKAAASYRAGNFQQSIESLQNINEPDALYNKGNALAKAGDLQHAIEAYGKALELDPNLEDAKYNRDLLQEYLKKQQQSQDGQSKDDESQDSQSQNKQSQENQSQENQSQDGQSQNESASSQDSQQQNSQDQGGQRQNAQHEGADQNQTQQDQAQSPQDQLKEQQDAQSAQAQQDKQNNKEESDKQQQAAKQIEDEETDNKSQQIAGRKMESEEERENMLRTEQWLRRIPDDPGGLLRRKFLYQSQIDPRRAKGETKPW